MYFSPFSVPYTTAFVDPLASGNYQFGDNHDGILYGKDVQHDTMPYYVRGNVKADLA